MNKISGTIPSPRVLDINVIVTLNNTTQSLIFAVFYDCHDVRDEISYVT